MKIKFEIEDIKYVIEDIKIKDYYQIKTDLLIQGREAEFNIISKLSGCPVSILRQISIIDWNELVLNLEIMLSTSFKQGKEVVKKFVHNGIEYGICDLNKLTIGEFSDLDVIVTSENADSKLHEMLAILYRPIVDKKWGKNIIEPYDVDGFKYRSQIFLEVPIDIAQSVSGFFLRTAQASLKTMQISSDKTSDKTTKRIMKSAQEMLMLLQDSGILHSSNLLEKIHLKSEELQNLASEKHLTFFPIDTIKPNEKNYKNKKLTKNIIA